MKLASPHYDRDTLIRQARESDLDQREAERDCYRQLTAVVGRVPLRLVQTEERDKFDTACAGDSAPSVPWRRNFRQPKLSAWTRLRLWWTRLCASFGSAA